MGSLDLQYDILNDAPATASPVETNFNRVEQFMNTEVITRDGTTAMIAPLRLYGDPVQNLDAATKSYVDSIMPLGLIMMFAGTGAPAGAKWALCNGAEVETVTYQKLFEVIGNNYTAAPVAGRFNLPNLQGRMAVGPTTEDPAIVVGNTGGSRSAGLPAHSHQMDHGHSGNTDQEQGWHSHNGIDHLHRVSGYSGGQNQSHYHGVPDDAQEYIMGKLGGQQFPIGSGQPFNYGYGTNWASNDHAHWVDIWSGAADRALVTGNQNQFHTHPFTTSVHSGRTASEGAEVPAATANMPPFLCVQFIIRVS